MGTITREIAVEEVCEGMHVVALDRPWHETPFPIQGFYVKDEDEIHTLTFYCKTVQIEIEESNTPRTPDALLAKGGKLAKEKLLKVPEISVEQPYSYGDNVPFAVEVGRANDLVEDVARSMTSILTQVKQGKRVDFEVLDHCAQEMTDSVIRNPDALLFLSQVKHRDAHTYSHSLKTAIWALIIARSYEMDPESIKNIGVSALMCKVGRVTVMDKINKAHAQTQRRNLDLYQTYPTVGASMLEESGISEVVIEGVKHHRERHNGSGFPLGLTGEKIPLSAKIVGIADFYEFLVEHRTEKQGMSPPRAASLLFKNRDVLFQADLVEKLIQTIGIYPVGSNVVLSDGRVGIVTALHSQLRLSPTLKIIKDQNGNLLTSGEEIDLSKINEALEDPIIILQCLPFHSFPELKELELPIPPASDERISRIGEKFQIWRKLVNRLSPKREKPAS